MAKKQDKKLLNTLRAGGMRKKVARALTDATGRSRRSRQPKAVEKTIENFRTAAAELDKRVRSTRRSEAGKKAARTRKRNAATRSAAARKGARKRGRSRS